MQRSLVVLVVLCLASGRALAKVPSPADSDVPCQINLVGSTSGVPDARGQFTIVARDLAHNPLAGCSLAMDFSACGPDIRVGSVKMVAGSAAQCLGGLIYAVTDANGQATLVLTGSADNLASGTTGAGFKCATLYGDGAIMGTINIGTFDENGAGGVNPADISAWLRDSFGAAFVGRSDFNCTNTIDPADLSLLLAVSLGATSFESCQSYCH